MEGITDVDYSDPHLNEVEQLPDVSHTNNVVKWYPACPNCGAPQPATEDQLEELRRKSKIYRNVVCESCGFVESTLERNIHIHIKRGDV